MNSFEASINKAVKDGVVAGAAVIAVDKNGTTRYSKGFGKDGVGPNARPFDLDTLIWIASCTKLLTAISALQCVEQGLLNLDEPVGKILPELSSLDILTGFDEKTGTPQLKKATVPITLRLLLSHSSGLSYPFLNPKIAKFLKAQGRDPLAPRRSVTEDYKLPLTYEPGQGWEYSCGIDYAGLMVERVNGGMKLGEYMKKHIFDVLGMESTTFRPKERPELMERFAGRPMRQADGTLKEDDSGAYPIATSGDHMGGAGLYSTATDYVKVLGSILADDGKLLKSESAAELFRPSLPNDKYLMAVLDTALRPLFAPGMPESGIGFNYSVGGILYLNDVQDCCGKNTLAWGGLPNSNWYIDRERGVCGFYSGQLFPPGDLPTQKLFAQFRNAMYAEAEKV